MFDIEKKEIDTLFKEKQYCKSLEKCKELKRKIDLQKIKNIEDYWYVYHNIGRNYWRLKNYKLQIEYTKKAQKYCLTESDRAKTSWLLGLYYKPTNIQKSNQCYDYSLKYYASIQEYDMDDKIKENIASLWKSKSLLFEKSDVQMSIDYMEISAKIYEEIYNNKSNNFNKNDLRDKIDDIYVWLYDLYLHKIHNEIKAKEFANKVILEKYKQQIIDKTTLQIYAVSVL